MQRIESVHELADACQQFESAWREGDAPRLHDYLLRCVDHLRLAAFADLLRAELQARLARGDDPQESDYLGQFPEYSAQVRGVFARALPATAAEPPARSAETVSSAPSGGQSHDTSGFLSVPDEATFNSQIRPSREAFAPGSSIGRYRVLSTLGGGGFGLVYLARDEQLGREVAVKVIDRATAQDPLDDLRQSDEGRAVARLDHPSIAQVYDVGVASDGRMFIVSKYIAGESLDKVLKRGAMPIEQARRVAREVAEALTVVHQQGLTHRDVKPANIILSNADRAVLVDFGIAIADRYRSDRSECAGTPAYMSPEQAAGSLKSLDGRSDIFGLGVVLYEMLTGQRPFGGESIEEVLQQIRSTDPRPPRQYNPAIPQSLQDVAMRCLNKDPAERFDSAVDIAQALAQPLPSEWRQSPLQAPPSPVPPSPSPTPAPSRAPRPAMAWIAAVALLVIAAAVWVARSAWLRDLAGASSVPGVIASSPTSPSAPSVHPELAAELRSFLELRERERFLQQVGPPASAPEAPSMPPDASESTETLILPAGFEQLESDIAKARQEGDEDREFSLLQTASNELLDQGHYRIAESVANRMVFVGGDADNRRPFAYGQLGLAQYRNGKVRQAISNYEVSLADYQSFYEKLDAFPKNDTTRGYLSHLARLLGITWMRIGNAHSYEKRFQLAAESFDKALELYERHDRDEEMLTLLLNYGSLESRRGNDRRAVELLTRGLDLCQSPQQSQERAELLVNLANAQARAKNSAAAIAGYEEAATLVSPESSYAIRTALLINWATELVQVGQIEQAKSKTRQLREIMRPGDKDSQRFLSLLSE